MPYSKPPRDRNDVLKSVAKARLRDRLEGLVEVCGHRKEEVFFALAMA